MKLPIKGVIPPMVTPLLEDMELDLKGLNKLIEHLLKGGVHGIFLLGTNGEGPSLAYDVRKQLITEASKIVDGRVPILVGITDTSITGSLEIADHALQTGADALVVAPPYYFPISQDEMVRYLEVLVPELSLPFLLYDIPSCTKLHLSLETIRKAKELGAIGIKDSSGDLTTLYTLIEEFKGLSEFTIIAGAELFLPETIIYGGHGVVAGGANIFPRLFVDLYEASCDCDLERIKSLRQKILRLHHEVYTLDNSSTSSIKVIKGALEHLGICYGHMATPLRRLGTKEHEQLKKHLDNYNWG